MIGLHLLLLAVAGSTLAPGVLTGAGWVYRSPRLGIAAWYAVLVAVLSAVAGAVLMIVAPWQAANAPICLVWRWCVRAARGEFGSVGRATVAAVGLAGTALAVRLLLTGVRLTRAASARRRRHRRMLAVAGRPAPVWGVTVVDDARLAAYVVAGAGRRIVVTTAAVDRLRPDELAAVLAHERAHAAGRHDLLLDGVRVLHQAFPRMVLFTAARAQLSRLVELRADEAATVGHARISLARALVAMATANAADQPVPSGLVVAATGGEAAERLRRLLTPPAPLPAGRRWAVAAAAAVVALGPAALVVAAQLFPVLGMCPAVLS
jgi:Zn-dependent protease with chaperone function